MPAVLSLQDPIALRERKAAVELKRRLGLLHVFCIASGAMISSGIFVLPGLAYARAGPAVGLSYLLAGALAATGLLSTAELATAMPKAGSDYFFITRSVGPAVGTIAGVLNWVSFSLKSAFALVGMAALIRLLAPIDMRLSGVGARSRLRRGQPGRGEGGGPPSGRSRPGADRADAGLRLLRIARGQPSKLRASGSARDGRGVLDGRLRVRFLRGAAQGGECRRRGAEPRAHHPCSV